MSDSIIRVNSVKRGINEDTFQPLLNVNLDISVELATDASSMFTEEEVFAIIGKEFIQAVKLKMEENKDV